ncbi:hypothetical protein HK100_012608 [Physocladia obscura]|uniref:Glycosyl transferase CAP10 domain-containing protein n=1 Tax=Physocladia obscura TaxID=109957 RepID=A0AAD5XG47_9FUNG|nr:hypothetical protein HK100_012608 [Physocladia obscura]
MNVSVSHAFGYGIAAIGLFWYKQSEISTKYILVLFVALNVFTTITIFPIQTDPIHAIQQSIKSSALGSFLDNETIFNVTISNEKKFDNIAMTHDQCQTSFPRLYQEADRSWNYYKKRGISKTDLDALSKEQNLRVVIQDNKVYIKAFENGINTRTKSVAAAIHEVVMMSPEPIPDSEFVLNTDDRGTDKPGMWALARLEKDETIWLYPDFGFYSWPEVGVDSYDTVRVEALEVEKSIHLSGGEKKKIDKLLWRGAAMTDLRKKLLTMKDQPWADFQEIDWDCIEKHETSGNCKDHSDLKSIPEHCNYKFLMQTEGWSYSGRMNVGQ